MDADSGAAERSMKHNGWGKGEDHPQHKLTEADVINIRNLYFKDGLTQQAIADRFGVSQAHVGKIINKQRWGHVKE